MLSRFILNIDFQTNLPTTLTNDTFPNPWSVQTCDVSRGLQTIWMGYNCNNSFGILLTNCRAVTPRCGAESSRTIVYSTLCLQCEICPQNIEFRGPITIIIIILCQQIYAHDLFGGGVIFQVVKTAEFYIITLRTLNK